MNNYLATSLLQRSNPFRTEYSVPVAFKELIEVALMFKFAASGFLAFGGNSYLNYKFGWESFARDIRTLAGITTHIERRIREINSLAEHGSLRRKLTLEAKTSNSVFPNTVIFSSYGVTVRATVEQFMSVKYTGSVTWRLNNGIKLPTEPLSVFNQAVRLAFDLEEVTAATLYELIPFSWLADYFIQLGPLLNAGRGNVKVTAHDICIMREYESRTKATVSSIPAGVSYFGAGTDIRVSKERDVVSVPTYPLPNLALLNLGQMKVLLALAAKFSR